MCPLIAQFVEHVDFAKGAEDAAHETGFPDGFLDGVEAGAYDVFGANDTGDGAGDFAKQVVGAGQSFLAGGNGVSDLLGGFQARVEEWYGDHPDAMLDAGGKHRNFGK